MTLSQPEYDVLIIENVMATMRDGVRLAADVFRPTKNGTPVAEPLPVILERTPYNKSQPQSAARCRYFAQRGYVFVAQDIRGCYASEGELYFLVPDAYDGYVSVSKLFR